jgi:hypothetical protein
LGDEQFELWPASLNLTDYAFIMAQRAEDTLLFSSRKVNMAGFTMLNQKDNT